MMRYLILFFTLSLFALGVNSQVVNTGNLRFFAGAEVAFFGDVMNNGTLVDSAGAVVLAGSDPQMVGGSAVTTFHNLTLDNSSTTGVTLTQEAHLNGELTLTDGTLTSSSSNPLVFDHLSTVTGASNDSYISGPVKKQGNQAFVFPVGTGGVYAPIAISAPSAITDQFTAAYFYDNPGVLYNGDSLGSPLDHISQCEYWTLQRDAGSSDVTVDLSWDTRSCGVETLPDLRVARWDGTKWTDRGNGGTTGTPMAGTVQTSLAQSSFGFFTLASISVNNVLPIGLLEYEAYCEGDRVRLNWSTASEMNSDYYTVERSTDVLNWTTVGTIEAAGSSSTLLNYSMEDRFFFIGGITYYRLSQTDINGAQKEIGVVSVNSCNESGNGTLTIYPNPSNGQFSVFFSGDVDHVTGVEIYSAMGEPVYTAAQYENTFDLSDLPAGVYTVRLLADGKMLSSRVVLQP